MPHSPDNVDSVSNIGEIKVDQVAIGSCTNSSFVDMMKVAKILKGKTVCPTVSLCIAPGSKQVLNMLAMNGALGDMIGAGARILESACGPCIGMGQSPNSGGISLRTFNRNFEGRSGTKDAGIYLVTPEVAAASALTGYLTDPRDLGEAPTVEMPEHFTINDNMIEPPASPEEAASIEVLRGPNIKPFPKTEPLPESITAKAVLKVGDNITTDHIIPAGAKILPYLSNIPHLSQFCFGVCDESFPERIKAEGKGIIIGGANYEPVEENPMLGFRGASRYISNQFAECFAMECRAMKFVRDEMGLTNVELMIPFVRTLNEAKRVNEIMEQYGLKRGVNGLRLNMMCEIPSNAVLADQFLEYFDGFSIGSNDMTQLALGLDRDSGLVAASFDERDPAVKALLAMAIKACRERGKYVGICGQGPSDHADFAAWLMEQGIESISLNPDTVVDTWRRLAVK